MNVKLRNDFTARTPFYVRRRNGMIFFQTQIEVARDDGFRSGIYCEYAKIEAYKTPQEIGSAALSVINRFHELSDMTDDEFYKFKGMSMDDYKKFEDYERLQFMGAKDSKELDLKYEECTVGYYLSSKKYKFALSWVYKKGNQYLRDLSDSTGEKGILTFEKPLEFDDSITAEMLGEMILEAFERSKQMAEKMSSKTYPVKLIDLFEGTTIEVTPPKDKHFIDCEDAGVGELYQVYSYITREGAASSADFMLSAAPELYEALTCESIRSAWTEAFGESDMITISEKQYGIFQYRAEMINKKIYRIAYFADCKDGSVLECCMEIAYPNQKKKLIEKLPALFEQFALNCKVKS